MNKKWHSNPIINIFSELATSEIGLSGSEVEKRLKQFGPNVLPKEKPYSKIRLFFGQFNSPLMYILLGTVALSFLMGHYADSLFIVFVLLINTTVGFYQENKANQSLLALKKMVRIKAKVLRDGHEQEIDSEELVPGDVVLLKSGDKIPADGRIIRAKAFKVSEASLTGESHGVSKENIDVLNENTPLPERTNMVFMGTIVEEGRALMVIVSTGINSQIGDVFSLLKETKERKTPLQYKIISLSRWVGAFVLSIVGIILIEGFFTQKDLSEVFIASIALAVSAIPEGLLPAITVILVLGMRRIFKQNGLIRKLAATETLGSVTVICTDKTGTLTEGKMQVSHILTTTTELMDGIASSDVNGVESHISALKIAMLVNDAFVENPEAELEDWIIRGTPTEKALLLAGMQSGLSRQELESRYPVIDKINFESEHKMAAGLHQAGTKNTLYVIGAPEEILARCSNLDIDGKKEKIADQQAEILSAKLKSLTEKGLRVLCCAHKDYEKLPRYEKLIDEAVDLSFVGFIALKDPIRKDAKESILITKKAGIRTVIVTGDHKLTTKTIAAEIGIDAQDENILEGKQLESMSDTELKERVKHISIFARVSPRHKLRIVDAFQANGEIVAMLGDGVNDAPALKSADIGVAIGSGTDVAKEVADLVLLDDNFKTILKAIEQGRLVFQNIRKVLIYLVADDFSELFLFLASIALGLPIPLLAAQILWINVVEDGFPDIALTTEKETKGLMEDKPRRPREPILNAPIKKWMAAIFFITGIAAFLTFFILLKVTGDLDKTRTVIFALMCLDSLIFAFSVRSFKQTIFRKDIFSNHYLVLGVAVSFVLLIGALYFAPLQALLKTQPLNLSDWALISTVSIIEIILIEYFKKLILIKKSRV